MLIEAHFCTRNVVQKAVERCLDLPVDFRVFFLFSRFGLAIGIRYLLLDCSSGSGQVGVGCFVADLQDASNIWNSQVVYIAQDDV